MAMNSRWKRIATIAVSSGMSQAITFVFGMLLVRKLSQLDYAVYRQGMLIVNTINPFFAILSPISLSYYFAKAESDEERRYYVKQTVTGLTIVSLLGSLLFIMFKKSISESYNNPLLSDYIIYFVIILFAESSTQYFAYYMVCIEKEKVLVALTVFFSALKTLSLIIAIFIGKNLFLIFISSYTLIVIFKSLFVIIYTYKYNNGYFTFGLRKDLLKHQLLFSLPVYFMGIINTVNLNLDKNIVAILFQPERYAIYENGAYQIPFINVLSSSIISVMLPDISKRFKSNNRNVLNQLINDYNEIIKISFGVLFSVFIAIFACSEGVIILLFSEKYIEALPIFRMYLFMVLFQSLNLGVLLTSANQQKKIVAAGIAMLLCNFSLLLFLANIAQFNWLSVAPILATLLMNVILLFSIKKTYKQKSVWNVLPLSYIGKIVIPGLINCIAFIYIQRLILINIIVKTIIFGPVCFFVQLGINYLFFRSKKDNRLDRNGE